MNKIYLVKAISCGVSADDAFDYTVGYATTLEEAEAACKKLKALNKKDIKFWNKYGCNCVVGCEAWSSATDPGIDAELKKMKKLRCPHAKLEIEEMFYGKQNASDGFELTCKNKSERCCYPEEYMYTTEEIGHI